MTNGSIKVYISPHRLQRYLEVTHGDEDTATDLYFLNLDISCELLKLILFFETTFRNQLDNFLKDQLKDDNWLLTQSKLGERLQTGAPGIYSKLVNTGKGITGKLTHAKVLANMDFGFWRFFFHKNVYRALGWQSLCIFHLDDNTRINQKLNYISRSLQEINQMLNRVCHCDQIILGRDMETKRSFIDLSRVESSLETIENLITMMCGDYPERLRTYETNVKQLTGYVTRLKI